MDKLKELLAGLKTALGEYIKAGTDGDQQRTKEVLDHIRTNHHSDIWQPIANVGFAAGAASKDTTLASVTAERDAAKTALAEAERKVSELSGRNVDVAKIQQEAAQKVADAEKMAREAKEQAQRDIREAFQSRDVSSFVAELIAGGMDKDVAEAKGVLLERRMAYDSKGVLSVFQMDSATGQPGTIPYTVHGPELLKVLAKEALEKAPLSTMTSRVDNGGGTGGDRAGGGPPTGDVYKKIQAEEKARADEDKKRVGGGPGGLASAYGMGGGSRT